MGLTIVIFLIFLSEASMEFNFLLCLSEVKAFSAVYLKGTVLVVYQALHGW